MASRFSQTREIGAQELAVWASPRTDLLVEEPDGDGAWVQRDGPFTSYRRTLASRETSDGYSVTEYYEFKLGIAPWSPLISFLMRRALREDSRAPHGRWWWPQAIVSETTVRLLSVLTVIAIIAGYLGVIIGQTITFAAAEFGASDTTQGDTLAAVRIGVIGSTIVIARADRSGRRPLILWFALGSILFTIIGAASTGMVTFGLTQGVARALDTGLLTLITLSATEEVPARVRALSISLMAMCSALGGGMVLWVLPISDTSVSGWRFVYLIAGVFLPILWWAWRNLPETRRFDISDRRTKPTVVNRRRFALIAFSAFAGAVFLSPASQLLNEYLRDDLGFTATSISVFRLIVYAPAGLAVLIAGILADRLGRRYVGAIGLGVGSITSALIYFSDGSTLWILATISPLIGGAAYPALRGYQTELFPTRARARVGGWIDLIAVTGSAVGLLSAGRLADRLGGLGPALAVLLIGPLLVVVLILVAYPETAARELEEFNPGDPKLSDQPAP